MEIIPCDVKVSPLPCPTWTILRLLTQGKTDTSQGKVNILLQGHISRLLVDDFTLISDTAYAAQNGGRIIRALLEIAISRKWANATTVLMGMSKAIEKRMWPFDQPLRQFDLKRDLLHGLETWADEWAPSELALQSAEELGKLVHLNPNHGKALLNAAKQFPALKIDYALRPLGFDVLKISVRITKDFTWSAKYHGTSEPFWVWVEDHEGLDILQVVHLLFRQTTEFLDTEFVISVSRGKSMPSVTLRYVSDRWMGAEDEIIVPLDDIVMPLQTDSHTPALNLPFLPITVIKENTLQNAYSNRVHTLNAIQTQSFWGLMNTPSNALLSAPAGSGKSMLAQMMVW
jgi:antiviral helicase SLH1